EEVPLPLAPVVRRRHEPSGRGTIDLRATLQAMARPPATLLPRHTRPRRELPSIVVLLDISGSMDRYARLLLHWIHGLTRRHLRVSTLTFGTRLPNITRSLRPRAPPAPRDPRPDAAPPAREHAHLRHAPHEHHAQPAAPRPGRRPAAGRGAGAGLEGRHAHRLVPRRGQPPLRLHAPPVCCLTPRLRYGGFEPRAAGVRALLPHVDRFLPVHNLQSLADLGEALGEAARFRL